MKRFFANVLIAIVGLIIVFVLWQLAPVDNGIDGCAGGVTHDSMGFPCMAEPDPPKR